ncbi:MAG: peptidylprolyl isomerase [Lentisphaeria bacterium]
MKKNLSRVLITTSLITVSAFLTSAGPARGQQTDPATTPNTADRAIEEKTAADINSAFDFLPDVVAECNDISITDSDVKDALPPQLMMYMARGNTPPPDSLKQIARQTVTQLINQKLLEQAAAKAGFATDTTAAEKQVEAIRQKIGDEKFQAGLKHQNVSREELVQTFAVRMAVNKWIEADIIPTIEPGTDQLKEAYEKRKADLREPEKMEASHILVKIDDGADAATIKKARAEIDGLAEQIENGTDFAELAKANSDGPSAKNGGNLGEITPGDTVKPFNDAAFALQEGEVSKVVKTSYGFHIIKAGKKTPAHTPAFDQVKEKLKQQLIGEKMNQKLGTVIEEARQKADIQVFLDTE